jgi:hypothetical protein
VGLVAVSAVMVFLSHLSRVDSTRAARLMITDGHDTEVVYGGGAHSLSATNNPAGSSLGTRPEEPHNHAINTSTVTIHPRGG